MDVETEAPPPFESGIGRGVRCIRRGASHLRAGTPCQDAADIQVEASGDRPCVFLAVADGHGDVRHDRSEFGARFAIEAAMEEMRTLHRTFGCEESIAAMVRSLKSDVPRFVVRRWRELVLQDAESRGEALPEPEEDHALLTRYGTTILMALATPGAVLIAQIGDGDILVLGPGTAVESPFQHDSSLVGGAVHSLASRNAHQLWQTSVVKAPAGRFVLLATDGLSNAFTNEKEFHTFANSLAERVREYGMEKVGEALPGWLDGYSEMGSGDDITIALLWLNENAEVGAAMDAADGEEHKNASNRRTGEWQPDEGESESNKEAG